LRIDVIVIKKSENIKIEKNIGRIFRKYNIIEYKSPDDYLSINDFLKVYAYANLYSALTPDVDFSEITLTFIENRHPGKLIKYLKNIRRYKIEEASPGIYNVIGDYLPIQIIQTGKLSETENLWIKSLKFGLERQSYSVILEEANKKKDKIPLGAYLYAINKANFITIKEETNMAVKTKRYIPTDEEMIEFFASHELFSYVKEKYVNQGIEQGIEKGDAKCAEERKRFLEMLDQGLSVEEIKRQLGAE
jgi:hypothetical protein